MTYAVPDIVNGLFEIGGGIFNCMNIYRLLKDKQLKGVSMVPTTVYSLWGLWNLYYYPHLGQWFSFIGGCGIVWSNLIWIYLALKYTYFNQPKRNDPLSPVYAGKAWK